METKVIHLWTGPRCLSTSLMYSFSQRSDTLVLDEPLYAYWLANNPDVFRPYREQLLKAQKYDGNEVMKDLSLRRDKPLIFAKHMAKQFTGLNKSLLLHSDACHIFLIRNPLEMIPAWERKTEVHNEEYSLEAMGLPIMCELYSFLRRNGQHPVVVDAGMLQTHPKEILEKLCSSLGINFEERQLSWPKGPKPDIDGLWASYWYDSVHKSTAFSTEFVSTSSEFQRVSEEQVELYREALPFFTSLQTKAIGIDSLNPGSTITKPSFVSSLDRLADPRNANVLVWVGRQLVPRELAKVSVFDSAVQGGDAVWEGIRIYNHRVFKLEEHLDRLFDSAKALAFQNLPSRAFVKSAIFTTLAANGMTDRAHIRLTLTRGPKLTSSMNPVFNIFGCNLIVLAEWKAVGDVTTYNNQQGIRLITACNRRNPAQCVDSKIHHCNMINNILPKIQANVSNAADALMLDVEGFVSETNATNIFLIKHGVVHTPTADSCLPGVTRKTVIVLCKALSIECVERRVSLTEFYTADEVFTTGTMGELTPVREIDGRIIGEEDGGVYPGNVLHRLQSAYRVLTETEGIPLPFE